VSDAATYCPDCGIRNPADTREELLEVDRAAIARLPVDDWCEAEKARDIDAKVKLFTTDAVLMPSAESNVIGQQAIRAWHEKIWDGTEYECSGTVEEVQVFGDWGMVRGTFSGVFTTASGELQPISGKYLDIVRRQADGSWKIARAIWNLN
jgi:uncharacterized protein (TIGR02246 family)